MKYICKYAFDVEMCDEDGFSLGEYMTVEVGEVYEVIEDKYRFVGGDGTIRLENHENGNWLELLQETIDHNFEKAEGVE